MSDGYVQVAPDSTGAKIDTTEVIRPDGTTVDRQRVSISEDDQIDQKRNDLLSAILAELKEMNLYLIRRL